MKAPATLLAALCLVFLSACAAVGGAVTPAWQRVGLDSFFGGLTVPVPLSINLPGNYVAASGINAPVSHTYWMSPEDVALTRMTGKLPPSAGYIFGNMAPGVRYDRASGKFSGEDEMVQQLSAAGIRLLDRKRWLAQGRPVLAVEALGSDGREVQVIYIATLQEGYCLYIMLRPPAGNPARATELWQQVAQSIR